MTRFEIIRTLRRHLRLSERRSVMFTRNKAAKVFIYISLVITVLYMLFISIMLALIANSSETTTAVEMIFGILPFLMGVDFFFRFLVQQTPSQLIKPYVLLPLPKYACIDTFMVTSLTNSGNLLWMALFAPYALMSIVFSRGLLAAILFLIAIHLVVLIWSQFYMLVRSLINVHYLWWLLPIAVFAVILSPWYIGKNANIETLCDFYAQIGTTLERHPWIVIGVLLLILAGFVALNRRLQYRFVYNELAKVEVTHIKHASEMKSLDRFGIIGEFVKLEIKSIMRNKNCRTAFIWGIAFVLMFSLLISFTNIYDSPFMKIFLILYNFSIFGSMLLSRIMCFEGNYIDCLMVHRENILSLFKAKYYFYSSMLLLPLLLMIPMLVMGKTSILALLSVLLFTAGIVYFFLFMLSLFNKQTMPLNTKFMGKGNMETNWVQIVVQLGVYFLPIVLVFLLRAFFSENVAFVVFGLMGLGFIICHKMWLRWIYGLLMKRRYEMMEGLRGTR